MSVLLKSIAVALGLGAILDCQAMRLDETLRLPADVPRSKPSSSWLPLSSTSVYVEYRTGQEAGMDNVILHPKFVLDGHEAIIFPFAHRWRTDLDLSVLYGTADTGSGTTGSEPLEARAHASSLYDLYNKDNVLRFNTGLYAEFAFPLQNFAPYYSPNNSTNYALEENEKLSSENLWGLDFDMDLNYDRLQSSFHNIFFLSGNRIGPNLLAYSPVLAFDWSNRAFLIGTASRAKLDFVTSVKFWFARKGSGTSLLNAHDGVGGTKREIELMFGLEYYATRDIQLYVNSYGDNNLNRGNSSSVPSGFRDGFIAGLRYDFGAASVLSADRR